MPAIIDGHRRGVAEAGIKAARSALNLAAGTPMFGPPSTDDLTSRLDDLAEAVSSLADVAEALLEAIDEHDDAIDRESC